MNGIDRFERELPVALADVAGAARPDYLNDVLGQTARTRQRPAWASAQRWLPMELATPRAAVARVPWRLLAVAALIGLVAAAFVLIAGSQHRVPPPFGPAANGNIPFEKDLDIYIGDPATGQARLLVGGPERDYVPSFSPDGTQVAFLRASADCPTPGDNCPGGEEIVVAPESGGGTRVITRSPLLAIQSAGWAPDSRSLIVDYAVDGKPRLALLPVDGGEPHLLLDGIETDWAMYRPPTGDEILVRGRLLDRGWGLYLMNADGSNVRPLATPEVTTSATQGPDQDLNFPAFSPDGSKIYYNRYTSPAGTIQAWVMNADGSNQHRFNASGPSCCWWEGEMAPSPDGKSVLMWRVPPSQPGAITLFPADGSGDGVKIGPPVGGTAHWAWSPDSTKILLNYNDPAEGDQGVIDVSTGKFTPLVWKADSEPDWQRKATR